MNYSMAITATGGFATHDTSVAYFNSATIEYIITAFMLLSGISYGLLYALFFKGKVKSFFKNSELRLYITIIAVSTLSITFLLVRSSGYNVTVSYTHLTLPTKLEWCRSRWSPYH